MTAPQEVPSTPSGWVLDDPIDVGPLTLRGRVYLPAHQPGLASRGQVTDDYVAYHRARARAGLAMQVTGATPIAPSSVWNEISLWNVDESIVPGYQQLSEAVHEEGGLMLAQLAHPGPYEHGGPDVIGPSRDFAELDREVVRPATAAELARIVEQYAEATDRCRRGGLDGVEISMAHGLLLAAFLSPLTNHRDDEYGGSFDRRLVLAEEVLDAVREAAGPGMAVGIRLGTDDLVEGGLRPPEAALVAAALEPRVDYLSVMVGNNSRLEPRVQHWPPTPAPFGLFREMARTVKAAVNKPVCAVGRVTTTALANAMVASGDADVVGMVRAHIADPELLPKSRVRRVPDVRPCVGANVCVNESLAGRTLTCLVNPDAGRDGEESLSFDVGGARVVVVGAGPAGAEAAHRLAARGYRVTLLERGDEIGGQVLSWTRSRSRREVRRFLEWQGRRLAATGVDLRLGVSATADDVAALAPALVLDATGALPAPLGGLRVDESVPLLAPGADVPRGARVVVYDGVGEADAMLLAEHAAESGATATLVTGRVHVGEGEGVTTLFPLVRRLAELGVDVVERARPVAAVDGQVVLEGVFGEARSPVPADLLLPWVGGAIGGDLGAALSDRGLPVLAVGDAVRPRRATAAVQEGARCEHAALDAGLLRAGVPV